MSLSAAFGEWLEQLDRTRNQRLSLLQRELQAAKSLVLESKRAAIRSMEERCLRLEWSLASELKCEVEELEEAEKEKDGFYRAQTGEMKDFKEATNGFVVDCQIRIEELRDELNEVKEKLSIFGSVS
ncbi:hypothetical protein ACJRO7_010761 [Eucalyptus globulus]|uniref:Tropomyosin n=1 Tax=Eucalyptus globulus TaxID=34317 RepID=A0ABD3LMY0_EUCGL